MPSTSLDQPSADSLTTLPDEILEFGPMDIDMRIFSPERFNEEAALSRVAAMICQKDYRETRMAVRNMSAGGLMDALTSDIEATAERQKALADLLRTAMVRLALAAEGIDREDGR